MVSMRLSLVSMGLQVQGEESAGRVLRDRIRHLPSLPDPLSLSYPPWPHLHCCLTFSGNDGKVHKLNCLLQQHLEIATKSAQYAPSAGILQQQKTVLLLRIPAPYWAVSPMMLLSTRWHKVNSRENESSSFPESSLLFQQIPVIVLLLISSTPCIVVGWWCLWEEDICPTVILVICIEKGQEVIFAPSMFCARCLKRSCFATAWGVCTNQGTMLANYHCLPLIKHKINRQLCIL